MRLRSLKTTIATLALTLAATAIAPTAAAQSYRPAPETLTYRVTYKWGLINKTAGTVTVTSGNFANGTFSSVLTGKSAPWADHFYSVRDTLRGTIMTGDLQPTYYEKIAHEDGDFKKDVIYYDRTGATVKADCNRWRKKKKDREATTSHISLEGTGVSLDMLSSFYYMRHLDYPAMQPGDAVKVNVFSGQRKETLKITYIARKKVEVQDTDYDTYYIKFSFTGEGGGKTSDDMYAWITADQRRIPVMLLGNLPIGSIRCYYEP